MDSRVRESPSESCCGLQAIALWWNEGNWTPLLLRGEGSKNVESVWKCDKTLALYWLVMGICLSAPFSETAAPMVTFLPLRPQTSKSYQEHAYALGLFCVFLCFASQPHSSSSSSSFLQLLTPPNSLIPSVNHCNIVPCCVTRQWMVRELHLPAFLETCLSIGWWTASHLPFVRESQQRLVIKQFGRHGIRN